MKKYLCLLLAGALLVGVCGCNNILDVSDDSSSVITTTTTTATTTTTTKPTEFSTTTYATYADLLKGKYANEIKLRHAFRDLDGDGQNELLLREDGTNKLIVYTIRDGRTHLLVEQDFHTGTSRFLDTGNADYPGIVYFCVGGGKDRYHYLALDKVQDKEFVMTPLWTDNYGFYEESEDGRITALSDDKRLIQLSRQAYEQNKDIYFSLVISKGHESWVRQSYDNAMRQYFLEPATYRDLGALQSETNDIILLDGRKYQSYTASDVNMRYIFVSNEEYEMTAGWDWIPIGTYNDYSLDDLGKIDDGKQ